MIDEKQSQNKSIPGPRLVRRYLSPSAPNAERMVCETCQREEPKSGGGIVHATSCAWAIQTKAQRVDNLP